jgi:hypothetical protein
MGCFVLLCADRAGSSPGGSEGVGSSEQRHRLESDPLNRSGQTHLRRRHGKKHLVDLTISELEYPLDLALFLRIHLSALLNIDWIPEVNS